MAAVAAEPFHGRDLADRLVRAFRTRNWEHIRPGMKVTASIGVAVLPPGRHAGETASIVTRLMAERRPGALPRQAERSRRVPRQHREPVLLVVVTSSGGRRVPFPACAP